MGCAIVTTGGGGDCESVLAGAIRGATSSWVETAAIRTFRVTGSSPVSTLRTIASRLPCTNNRIDEVMPIEELASRYFQPTCRALTESCATLKEGILLPPDGTLSKLKRKPVSSLHVPYKRSLQQTG